MKVKKIIKMKIIIMKKLKIMKIWFSYFKMKKSWKFIY
jgi:hypothetical protein